MGALFICLGLQRRRASIRTLQAMLRAVGASDGSMELVSTRPRVLPRLTVYLRVRSGVT